MNEPRVHLRVSRECVFLWTKGRWLLWPLSEGSRRCSRGWRIVPLGDNFHPCLPRGTKQIQKLKEEQKKENNKHKNT
ncbi:C-Jun-Amino-Terminal Kinase-Interacting Protein 3 [Manis pentadactyla]|nr:C-Jun-Amino-Terminal Kinase-Interacting Protein 3 [Manis pentadactyla]